MGLVALPALGHCQFKAAAQVGSCSRGAAADTVPSDCGMTLLGMGIQVTVALIADYDTPFEQPGPLDERWYDLPYHQRKQVTFDVAEHTSLAAVLERAAEAFGLQPPADYWAGSSFSARHRRVAFYKPEDDDGFAPRSQGRLHLGELILVDSNGQAIFQVHDLSTVRYRDLLRTHQAGALNGDPQRPYLIVDEGWGDAPPVDWATFQQGLEVAWDIVKTVGTAYGGLQAFRAADKWISERVRGGREALQANPSWAQRGYRPDQFATLLEISAGQPERLAQLLDCTPDEAQAIYWAIGYAYDDDTERWETEADEAAAVLRRTLEAIGWASHAQLDEWQPRLARWLQQYLETGQAPPLETLDPAAPGDYGDDFEVPMTLGERLDAFLERFRRSG